MKKLAIVAVLIVAVVFGIVAYAAAANSSDTKTVTVNASAKPKIVLTLTSPATLDFVGDPGEPLPTQPVGLTVKSNKAWNLTKKITSPALYTVSSNLSDRVDFAGVKGITSLTDDVGVTISWDAEPDTQLIGGSILYDVVTGP